MHWLAQAANSSNSWVNMLFLMAPVFIIMYVLMIRPQKQKEKTRKEMLSKVKKNDRVVTIGGIHGTVVTVKENEISIKVDEGNNTKLRFAKSAVAKIIDADNSEGGE